MKEIKEHPEDMNREDFAKIMEDSLKINDDFQVGDSVRGTVSCISGDTVFVDIGGKSEAIISASEFVNKDGSLPIKNGDSLSAYVASIKKGEITLTVKIGGGASKGLLETAYENGIPVEGRVTEITKGGFSVMVSDVRCFCPLSLMDIRLSENQSDYLNKTLLFKIAEYKESGRNIVLSRRALLEVQKRKQEEELKSTLRLNDIVKCTVASVQSFGLFMDLGGVQALLPRSELSWRRDADTTGYNTGDELEALVTELDWEKARIVLSLRKMQPEPWTAISRFPIGSSATARVTKLIAAGAFAELSPGLEGFIHISKMSPTKRIAKPEEVLSAGDSVSIRIIGIDEANKKISLELLTGEPNPWELPAEEVLGKVYTGIIESVKPAGAAIRLANGMAGFVPKEKLADKGADIIKSFPAGKEVRALAVEYVPEKKKLILSVTDAAKREAAEELKEFGSKYASSGSTLGDLLKDKFDKIKGTMKDS